MATIDETFTALQSSLDTNPAKLASFQTMNVTYQFELTGGAEPTYYALAITNGQAKVEKTKAESPSITITMSEDDFLKLSQKQLNPVAAYMGGKLKVKGEMGLAMKLQQLLA